MVSIICGVGINDSTTKNRQYARNLSDGKWRLIWQCPFYKTWQCMMQRGYSKNSLSKAPHYLGCSVSEEWLTLSNFKSWMKEQDYLGKALDKDLLVYGNKVYSRDTSIFVSQEVNSFMIEMHSKKSNLPIGVVKKNDGFGKPRYGAKISTGGYSSRTLGVFHTDKEAFECWLKEKRRLAGILADKQSDPKVAEALIQRYQNYVDKFTGYSIPPC